MSEEEETLETIEEQLAPEKVKPTTFNKNGKPRKQLSPEHLEKLANARIKAAAIRKQITLKNLENKIENINKETEHILGPKTKKEIKKDPEPEPEPEVPEEEVEVIKEKPKSKPKGKKKTKIIVEQSSEDSDEFEPNDNVVFVKRVSRKKKEPVKEPELERQPAMEMPPPEPDPPPEPKTRLMTPHQMMMRENYNNMFSGNFLNQNGMRRRY
jgi:hypothetical protein